MRFIETPVFTEDITRLLSDDAYCALQWALMPQGHGLRKLRWSQPGAGKRDQDDLTMDQLRQLARLVRENLQ